MEITTLKKSCQLFSRLYITCQVRDGNLDEFFLQKNGTYPPPISKNGDLMHESKSDLLHSLEKFNEAPATNMTMDCIMLDGAAIVNRNTKLKVSHHTSKNSCKGGKELALVGTFTSRIP